MKNKIYNLISDSYFMYPSYMFVIAYTCVFYIKNNGIIDFLYILDHEDETLYDLTVKVFDSNFIFCVLLSFLFWIIILATICKIIF